MLIFGLFFAARMTKLGDETINQINYVYISAEFLPADTSKTIDTDIDRHVTVVMMSTGCNILARKQNMR